MVKLLCCKPCASFYRCDYCRYSFNHVSQVLVPKPSTKQFRFIIYVAIAIFLRISSFFTHPRKFSCQHKKTKQSIQGDFTTVTKNTVQGCDFFFKKINSNIYVSRKFRLLSCFELTVLHKIQA